MHNHALKHALDRISRSVRMNEVRGGNRCGSGSTCA